MNTKNQSQNDLIRRCSVDSLVRRPGRTPPRSSRSRLGIGRFAIDSIWIMVVLLIFSNWVQAKVIEITDNGPDVKIPIQIWDQFGQIAGKDSVSFIPLTLRLVEKTPGVLIEPELEFKLARGGGQIDLSQFVKDSQGTFRVFFELDEVADESKMKAYFVSRARKRKIDDEVWGAGCNKYMDIKSFILKAGKKKGIEVNTTRNRHLSVLGGTFFFSLGQQVTQVTFVDSQQPQLFCETAPEK